MIKAHTRLETGIAEWSINPPTPVEREDRLSMMRTWHARPSRPEVCDLPEQVGTIGLPAVGLVAFGQRSLPAINPAQR